MTENKNNDPELAKIQEKADEAWKKTLEKIRRSGGGKPGSVPIKGQYGDLKGFPDVGDNIYRGDEPEGFSPDDES